MRKDFGEKRIYGSRAESCSYIKLDDHGSLRG